jgi:hypothetical protein
VRPPAGRIAVGDRVEAPGGRRGRVVAERHIVSNGAWRYTIALEEGGTIEHFDFELKHVDAA